MNHESPQARGGRLPHAMPPWSARTVLAGRYRILVVVQGEAIQGGATSLLQALTEAIHGDPRWLRLAHLSGSALALAGFAACQAHKDLVEPTFAISVGDAVRRGIPTAARATLTARAPLRGGLVEAPFGGGFAKAMVHSTDVLFVFGQSPDRWVLELRANGSVERVQPPFGAADDTTFRARALGPEKHRLIVGPAAEAEIPFANLGSWTAHSDAAPSFVGRGGVGFTVAGAGLAAITVEEPEDGPGAATSDQELAKMLEASPRLLARARGGTLELEALRPAREPGHGAVARAPLEGALRASSARSGKHGCIGCPTPCGWQFETGPSPSKVGARYAALQGFLGQNPTDPAQALAAVSRCNQLGVDARSAARLLQLAPPEHGAPPPLERLDSLLQEDSTLGIMARAFGALRDTEPASPFVPGDLSAAVGAALSARGPEPLRSLSILGLHRRDRARLESSLGVRGLTDDAEYNAGVVAHWHECFAAALDATGFCAFSAAGLIADGLLDLDGMAEQLQFAPMGRRDERGGARGLEWLEGGGAIVSVHRSEFPRETSPSERVQVEGIPARALEGYRAAIAGAMSAPLATSLGGVTQGEPQPRSGNFQTRVTVAATGALGSRLARMPGACSGRGGSTEITVDFAGHEPTVREVIEELARAVPSVASWLVSKSGSIVPAVLVNGRAVAGDEALLGGVRLELLLVVPGG